jgi:PAS domain S-box-containing protein
MNRFPPEELFEHIPDGLIIFDKEWRYVYLNSFAESITGKKKKDLIGQSAWEVFPKSVGGTPYKIYHQAVKTNKPVISEYFWDSALKWFSIHAYPSEHGLTVFFSDITQRKQIESNLRFLSEASKIVSSSLDYMNTLETVAHLAVPEIADWCSVDMLDEDGNIQLLAVAHKDPKKVKWAWELRKKKPIDLNSPHGLPKVLRTGKTELIPLITDEMLVASAKSKKELELARSLGLSSLIITPILVDGKPIGGIQLVTTETKRMYTKNDVFMIEELAARASLAIKNSQLYTQSKEQANRFKTLLESIPQMTWTHLPTGEINFYNQQWYDYTGLTREEKRADIWEKIIHPEDVKRTMEKFIQSLKTGKIFEVENRYRRASDETYRWHLNRALPLKNEHGEIALWVGTATDIDEQKQTERQRNDFVSIATHELKTPVTSIKVYAEVLQRRFARQGDEFSATQLGKMNAQLNRLTSLISDLLDATKIEAGKLQTHEELFDFDGLIREIVEELQRTTEKHQLIMEGTTKKNIMADRERTGQVLTNLISNAIKYSPNAQKILIQSSINGKYIEVCVQDFGIGIPKAKLKHVFEQFYRVSGPKDNTFPGLGLGLYISSEIIKRQGGRIWVESEAGKGSTFCFTLPL